MSELMNAPELNGAKETVKGKGIYDLSFLSQEERTNLLSVVFDAVCDLDNELYLKLLVSSMSISMFTFEEVRYCVELLEKRSNYCHRRIVEGRTFTGYYPECYGLCNSTISKLSSLLASDPEPEKSNDVPEAEPQEREEEKVNYHLALYYDDGTSYSRMFCCSSGKGIIFNFHRDHIPFHVKEQDGCVVYNIFNFPNSDKIATIYLSFLPYDKLPF